MSSVETAASDKRKIVEDDQEGNKKAKWEEVLDSAASVSRRVRKPKKVVLLMCYLGKDYYGMQKNNQVATVEDELFKSLLQNNMILREEYDHPQKMKFQRAARTDKGVSAVRQIVSLKVPSDDISNSFTERVNALLPEDIRVVGLKRVTQSFDAKIACDARTYSYMLPTFAFAKNFVGDSEDFRISAEGVKEVNDFLQKYVGTHNFYNFTSGRLPKDPSCKRYIISCECGEPFISSGIEFTVVQIKGQSFMLHQIRKMVGLAIAVVRNLADQDVLQRTWTTDRIDIPKAPGLGLMLEHLHYDWYNTKYGSDGIHEKLIWDEYDEVIDKFKMEKICANIAKTEREEKSMLQWLETLPHHSYDVRENGPPTLMPPPTKIPPPRPATTTTELISDLQVVNGKSTNSEQLVAESSGVNSKVSDVANDVCDCPKDVEIKS